jgi:hypothetical protein
VSTIQQVSVRPQSCAFGDELLQSHESVSVVLFQFRVISYASSLFVGAAACCATGRSLFAALWPSAFWPGRCRRSWWLPFLSRPGLMMLFILGGSFYLEHITDRIMGSLKDGGASICIEETGSRPFGRYGCGWTQLRRSCTTPTRRECSILAP